MTTADNAAISADRAQWNEARLQHLEAEKAFTRQRDELNRKRRALPWLEISENYTFAGPNGPLSLAEMFDGRQQLLVYHFMFGPDWDEGCPSCSFWADNYNGTTMHLAARDTTLVAISSAPTSMIDAYRTRMGWDFPWYSSEGSTFNNDMGVSFTDEQVADGAPLYNHGTLAPHGGEMPGISVFARSGDGRIFLTYQTFARGLDMLNGTYHLLDLTPKGRDEADLPWTMAWLRRNDQYSQRHR